MNSEDRNKKGQVMRSFALLGLAALIILIAWLSVQIVKVAPSAFTSLASLAEGIAQYEDTLNEPTEPINIFINEELAFVDSNEQTTLSWNGENVDGDYAFSYECREGVKVTIVNNEGMRDIDCDTNYNLGVVDSITLAIESSKERYVDVPYSVSYTDSDTNKLLASGEGTLTVTNRDINDFVATDEVDGEVLGETTDEEAETPTSPQPEPTTPEVTYEFEYWLPESNANGFVDLLATYLNVGDIDSNRFVIGELEQDGTGAIQFAVRNIGTKTSEDWTFTITLPDGSEYESDSQEPLKPNEQATLVIGFNTIDESTHTFDLEVDTDEDENNNNNGFTRFVVIQS